MAAARKTAFFVRHGLHNSEWSSRGIARVGLLAMLVGWTVTLNAADPYAAALDKRFESSASQAPTQDPGVAALETALKAQVRQMSTRPEVAPPVAVKQTQPWLILTAILTLGSALSLVAVMLLRRWDRWIDKQAAKRLSALSEDPLMSEFLRSLHEDPLLNQAPAPESTPVETTPTTATAANEAGGHEAVSRTLSEPLNAATRKVIALRKEIKKLGLAADDAERQTILIDLMVHIEAVKKEASSATQRPTRLLASALHGLLNQLSIKPERTSPSTLRTAAGAIDLLEILSVRTVRDDLATVPPVRFLAVDDDAISRRAVSLALKKAFCDADVAPEGRSALTLAEKQPYDVIFLDIEMPGMDGFELCSKIRETETNRTTPIVFVTSHTDFDSRAKSALVGAHDLIGKPFLAFEITVKALALVLKARVGAEAKGAQATSERGSGEASGAETGAVADCHRDSVPAVDDAPSQPASRLSAAQTV